MGGQGQFNYRQRAALSHPIRFRIVELFTKEAGRSLAVADLTADLGKQFDGVSQSQVSYHLRQLQSVDLIPLPSD